MPTQAYALRDKVPVPGTTTIIGASLGWKTSALTYWYWNNGKNGLPFKGELEKAAAAGTLAHLLAECHIKAKTSPPMVDIDPETVRKAVSAFSAFLQWETMSQLVLEYSELPLVSETLKYGGTLDAVGQVGGRRALIDFKTSNGTYADHIIQVAAYANLWEENHPREPLDGGIHILRFGKDEANFSQHYYSRETILGKPLEAFRALRTLYDLKKPIEALAK
jgi:hypothetical protein